jgi:hypothetical protein
MGISRSDEGMRIFLMPYVKWHNELITVHRIGRLLPLPKN